ncbi:hypothetical protein D3C78_1305690 [compost metagenome]
MFLLFKINELENCSFNDNDDQSALIFSREIAGLTTCKIAANDSGVNDSPDACQ